MQVRRLACPCADVTEVHGMATAVHCSKASTLERGMRTSLPHSLVSQLRAEQALLKRPSLVCS